LPNAGVIGCRLLNTDGSVQTSCIQKYPTILNQMLDVEWLRLRWPKCSLWDISPMFAVSPHPIEVEVVSGACMMIRREIFERVGMFSNDYFMYAEDIDLCYKIAQAGLATYFVGRVEIVHHGGKSSTQREFKQWSAIEKFRAMTHFCRKTHGNIYAFLFRSAVAVAATSRLAIVGTAKFVGVKQVDCDYAWAKWSAVLRWALGLHASPRNDTIRNKGRRACAGL